MATKLSFFLLKWREEVKVEYSQSDRLKESSAVLWIDKSGRRCICQGYRGDAEVIGLRGDESWKSYKVSGRSILVTLQKWDVASWREGHRWRLKHRCEWWIVVSITLERRGADLSSRWEEGSKRAVVTMLCCSW